MMISLRVTKLSTPMLQEFKKELYHENSGRLLFILYLVIISQITFIPFELMKVLDLRSDVIIPRIGTVFICGILITLLHYLRNPKTVNNHISALGRLITTIQFISLAIGCYFTIYMFENEIHSLSAFLLVAFIASLTCVRNPYFTGLIYLIFISLSVFLHIFYEPISMWTGEFLITLLVVILLFIGNILNYNRHIHLFLKEKEISVINQRLMEISQTDELTGIYNRRKLSEIVEGNINLSKRYHTLFCLAILDIDSFKSINDIYGHNTGDVILSKFTHRISSMLRSTDIFGRWGGEEFLLVLPNSDENDAFRLLERLRTHIETTDLLPNIRVTFSAGICSHQNDETFSDLINQADRALYAAKNAGRNRVVRISSEGK